MAPATTQASLFCFVDRCRELSLRRQPPPEKRPKGPPHVLSAQGLRCGIPSELERSNSGVIDHLALAAVVLTS